MKSNTAGHDAPRGRYLARLALGALGVVYGDIGTSPLYALRECFHGPHGIAPGREAVMGVLSLIFWSLVLVISVKYLSLVMRADNRGEGGILSLMALVPFKLPHAPAARRGLLIVLGLFGAALLYGDGMITPAISVLSAVEGLELATPLFRPYVLPLTLAVLVALFLFQRRGTARIGSIFGPVMLLWFVTLASLGAAAIVRQPHILAAVDPRHAVRFFGLHGTHGFIVLGSVFLVVTGGESLYIDMGHFGKRPIRIAWFALVFPALLVNYFGQGALLLDDPAAAVNPFYHLAPGVLLLPLVALSTAAAVIASQAVISGAFSLTRQAVQLGYLPRVQIRHTSAAEIGQIYIPGVNWLLMLASMGLVLGFRSSSNLAAAYGVAVTGAMTITTLLLYVVMRRLWKWTAWTAGLLAGGFLVMELAFLGSNLTKIAHGGWFPLVIGAGGYVLMSTWRRGRELLAERIRETSMPLDRFFEILSMNRVPRVPGTAIYMTGNPQDVPAMLLHNLRHNKVLHERVVLVTFVMEPVSRVRPKNRLEIEVLHPNFYRVRARYGFMQEPNMPELLELCRSRHLEVDLEDATFFLSRETLLATARPGMPLWRERLFALLSRNAVRATAAFRIPPDRVVELGTQVQL